MRFVLILLAFFISATAWAWPPTYGAEFNFSNDAMMIDEDYGPNREARDKMVKAVIEACKKSGCEVVEEVDNFRVTYKDGWWFNIAVDPKVVEVQTKPATLEELKALRDRMQTDIFDTAREAGMTAPKRHGGHIHVGAQSAFGLGTEEEDPELFRNFMVDFTNHTELSDGMWGNDHLNARPISALPEESQKKFEEIVSEFDHDGGKKSITKFATAVQEQVYKYIHPMKWAPIEKFVALNVVRIVDKKKKFKLPEKTIEARIFNTQTSADDFLLDVGILDKRLTYLKGLKHPIPLHIETMSPSEALQHYQKYITEAGGDWEHYKNSIDPLFYVEDLLKKGDRKAIEKILGQVHAESLSNLLSEVNRMRRTGTLKMLAENDFTLPKNVVHFGTNSTKYVSLLAERKLSMEEMKLLQRLTTTSVEEKIAYTKALIESPMVHDVPSLIAALQFDIPNPSPEYKAALEALRAESIERLIQLNPTFEQYLAFWKQCKSRAKPAEVAKLLNSTLDAAKTPEEYIAALSTIDLASDSPGQQKVVSEVVAVQYRRFVSLSPNPEQDQAYQKFEAASKSAKPVVAQSAGSSSEPKKPSLTNRCSALFGRAFGPGR